MNPRDYIFKYRALAIHTTPPFRYASPEIYFLERILGIYAKFGKCSKEVPQVECVVHAKQSLKIFKKVLSAWYYY